MKERIGIVVLSSAVFAITACGGGLVAGGGAETQTQVSWNDMNLMTISAGDAAERFQALCVDGQSPENYGMDVVVHDGQNATLWQDSAAHLTVAPSQEGVCNMVFITNDGAGEVQSQFGEFEAQGGGFGAMEIDLPEGTMYLAYI